MGTVTERHKDQLATIGNRYRQANEELEAARDALIDAVRDAIGLGMANMEIHDLTGYSVASIKNVRRYCK